MSEKPGLVRIAATSQLCYLEQGSYLPIHQFPHNTIVRIK